MKQQKDNIVFGEKRRTLTMIRLTSLRKCL